VVPEKTPPGRIPMAEFASTIRRKTWALDVTLLRVPTSFNSGHWQFHHPLDYIGGEGGGGIGGGPGICVGAALALIGSGRFPLALVGDGDYLMGVTALWTAAHYRIPLLMVIANNQSFYNDEEHQLRMARARGRPPENKWIGMRMADPEMDLAKLAEAQGALGLGPATDRATLEAMLDQAIAHVQAGGVAVIDARVEPADKRAPVERA
jgi:thiamine pyrophosphate-dependent acetolactate synthase large subunit-like protein